MMRLPKFDYRAPATVAEAARILGAEGPGATLVAGGTDLYPNMKRRQVSPRTLVSLRRAEGISGVEWREDGSVRIGAGRTLRALERDPRLAAAHPALAAAVRSISTPILRNMGTIGGNLCLDTRCNYLNQTWEWRRAIDFCKKCDGETCWVAPSSPTCWAVNSSDGAPVMMALGARVRLVGPEGERTISADDLYAAEDGRAWLTKRPDEVLAEIEVPAPGRSRSVYLKLRRRGAFDFPVLGVAARIEGNGVVERADLVLGALGPAPVRVTAAQASLVGRPLSEEAIEEAADLAAKAAKPLDNTDFAFGWRRKMVPVHVRRALRTLIQEPPR